MSNIRPAQLGNLLIAQNMMLQTIGPQFVVLKASPDTGFAVVGPFPSMEAADYFLDADENGTDTAWIIPLRIPKEQP